MTSNKNRILSVFLALVLLCACISPALADQGTSTYIQIKRVDYDSGEILSSEVKQVYAGWNTIEAGVTPYGYDAVDTSPVRIFVNSAGQPVTDTVVFYYRKPAAAATSASVTVYCIDVYGNRIYSYTETISRSQYVWPRSISGFVAPDNPEYVYFTNGTCSPAFVIFQYTVNDAAVTAAPVVTAAPAVTLSPAGELPENVVWPIVWDTQFKPGTTGPNTYNEGRVERLPNIADNNYLTSFDWLIWSEEREDDIPEITAYFDNATVSSVMIRNGFLANQDEYYRYARATKFLVKIFTSDGGAYETEIEIPDYYTTDYRTYYLDGTYYNVTRIEFFLVWFRCDDTQDIEHRYVIHVADMAFTE